ncbi:MAG TPA: hypothetical protein VME21_03600 [Steroidobacteraceae bacterium]|nr:hypothetical protein [Steroidobacteraceae bacterium]
MRVLDGQRVPKRGFATEYFLRQLAQARSRHPSGGAALAYSKALAEAIVLLVLMPSIALFCVLACLATLLPRRLGVPALGSETLALAFLATFSLVLIGHLWLGMHLRCFREDPTAALRYDTERDRRIVFWQKLIVSGLCGGVVPASLLWLLSNH